MNWRTTVSTIPRGNAGNLRTLASMSMLARAASVDPVVVQAAQDAVRPYPERDPDSDFAAILADVRRRMRYTHDPLDAEVVKHPRFVIDRTADGTAEPMDCDDASTLAAAMFGAIGYQTQFVTAAVDPSRPDEWSHVYLRVLHPDGTWVPADPIVRNFAMGDQVPDAELTAPRAYHEGVDPMIRGIGCERMMAGLGSHPAGLGYAARSGIGDAQSDMRATAVAAGGLDQASAFPAGSTAADTPWYSSLFDTVSGIFRNKSQADVLTAQAQLAAANARLRNAASGGGGGLFTNPDGSTNKTNVAVAVGVGAIVLFAIVKASRR